MIVRPLLALSIVTMWNVKGCSSPRPSGTSAGRSSSEGVEELLKALRRRGVDILDILVECLEEEKEANSELIGKVREGVWRGCEDGRDEGLNLQRVGMVSSFT